MEMQCPKRWFDGNHFGPKTTKQPRFDIVVLNSDGVGIVELKVNNDNTDNMVSHYEHMEFLLTQKTAQGNFLKEINRRVTILCDNKLVNEEIKEFPLDRLWCGFLFVGGEYSDTKEVVEQLKGKKLVDQMKFIYHPTFEIDNVNINDAVSYSDFVSL